MKTVIIVWLAGYYPLPFIFDTYDACHELELSLMRVADESTKLTPRQIYTRGKTDTPYFTPCLTMEIK